MPFLHWSGYQGANLVGLLTAGDNTFLQLCRGNIIDDELYFARVNNHDGDYSWNSVSGGEYSTYAIRSDGTIWYGGQSGSGTVPFEQVGTDTDWQTTSQANSNRNIQLKSNGTIWSGGTSQIGTDTDWTQAVAGGVHYAGLKSGVLYTWGSSNLYGELGRTSSLTPYNTPGQVTGASNWTQIALGRDYTIVLNSSGELWACGRNNLYQLGLGDTTNRSTLTQIGTDTDWAYVAAGTTGSLAIKTNGDLYFWGDGTTSTPTVKNNTITWSKAHVGLLHFIGMDTSGNAYTWGGNLQGQLGDGTTDFNSTPTRVDLSSQVVDVEAGNNHSIIVTV